MNLSRRCMTLPRYMKKSEQSDFFLFRSGLRRSPAAWRGRLRHNEIRRVEADSNPSLQLKRPSLKGLGLLSCYGYEPATSRADRYPVTARKTTFKSTLLFCSYTSKSIARLLPPRCLQIGCLFVPVTCFCIYDLLIRLLQQCLRFQQIRKITHTIVVAVLVPL